MKSVCLRIFEAQAQGEAVASAGPFTVDSGGSIEVEIRLASGRFIEVIVVEKTDRTPVPGADVSVSRVVNRNSTRGIPGRHVTNGKGRVRVGPLPAGELSFYAKCGGYARMAENLRVSDPSATEVTVELDRGRVLAGVVRLPDGSAAEGVHVSARHFVNGHMQSVRLERDIPRTDANGTFRIEGLPAGQVKLNAYLERDGRRYRGDIQTATGREGIEIQLKERAPAPAKFVLTVRGPDGTPVPRAWATYHQRGKNGSGSSGKQVKDGRCEEPFTARDGRQRWVEVCKAEDSKQKPLPLGTVLVRPLAPGQTSLEVTLPPERTVEGVVTGPDGRGVAGVAIKLHAVYPELRQNQEMTDPLGGLLSDFGPGVHGSATSGPDGSFRVGRLGTCGYTATIKPPDRYAPVKPLSVKSGAVGLQIVLQESARVRVTVLDTGGEPVRGAQVSAAAHGVRGYFRGSTDSKGIAIVTGIDSGTVHRLDVQGPDDRTDLMPFNQMKWTPADTTVSLERAYHLKVLVLSLDGRPVPHALVSYRLPGSNYWSVMSADAEGTFEIQRLAADRVTLRAVPRDGDIEAEGVAEVELVTSAGPAEIRIDPGVDIAVRITNWPLGADRHAYLNLSSAGKSRVSHTRDGVIRYSGFKPGEEAVLFLGPVGDGLCLLLNDLKAGDPERKATLVPGEVITGRLLLPAGATNARVWTTVFGCSIRGSIAKDGTFQIRGLPKTAGWTVEARATVDGKEVKASIEATPGTGDSRSRLSTRTTASRGAGRASGATS